LNAPTSPVTGNSIILITLSSTKGTGRRRVSRSLPNTRKKAPTLWEYRIKEKKTVYLYQRGMKKDKKVGPRGKEGKKGKEISTSTIQED